MLDILGFNLSRTTYLLPTLLPDGVLYDLRDGPAVAPNRMALLHADVSRQGALRASRYGASLADLVAEGRLLNGDVSSIEKRVLHSRFAEAGLPTATVAQSAAAETSVIVKSNANAGGHPEARMSSELRLELRLGPRRGRVARGPDRGYVVTTLGRLPSSTWESEDLVVEHYISNSRGLHGRGYVFGQTVVVAFECIDGAIKHMGIGKERTSALFEFGTCLATTGAVVVDSALVHSVANLALAAARSLSLDFGAVDFAIDEDGAAVPIDVNPTPSWTNYEPFAFADAARRGIARLILERGMGLE